MGAYEYVVTPDNDGIVYVKDGGMGNGSSWNEAGELSVALYFAKPDPSIKQVWAVQGAYIPVLVPYGNSNSDPRDRTFVLEDGISVYGGFLGNENSISQRPQGARSLLSGWVTPSDRAYHVVIANNNKKSTLLDGFTISDGEFRVSYLFD